MAKQISSVLKSGADPVTWDTQSHMYMTQLLLIWAGLFCVSFHSLPQLQLCSNPKRIQMRVLVVCSLLRHCQCVLGKAAGTEVAENGQVSASVFEQAVPGYTALLSLLAQGKWCPGNCTWMISFAPRPDTDHRSWAWPQELGWDKTLGVSIGYELLRPEKNYGRSRSGSSGGNHACLRVFTCLS